MRAVLDKLGVLAIPQVFALSIAHEAFDAEGRLKDGNAARLVLGVGEALCRVASRLV